MLTKNFYLKFIGSLYIVIGFFVVLLSVVGCGNATVLSAQGQAQGQAQGIIPIRIEVPTGITIPVNGTSINPNINGSLPGQPNGMMEPQPYSLLAEVAYNISVASQTGGKDNTKPYAFFMANPANLTLAQLTQADTWTNHYVAQRDATAQSLVTQFRKNRTDITTCNAASFPISFTSARTGQAVNATSLNNCLDLTDKIFVQDYYTSNYGRQGNFPVSYKDTGSLQTLYGYVLESCGTYGLADCNKYE